MCQPSGYRCLSPAACSLFHTRIIGEGGSTVAMMSKVKTYAEQPAELPRWQMMQLSTRHFIHVFRRALTIMWRLPSSGPWMEIHKARHLGHLGFASQALSASVWRGWAKKKEFGQIRSPETGNKVLVMRPDTRIFR